MTEFNALARENSLKNLLAKLGVSLVAADDIQVQRLCLDSRDIRTGDVFIALAGGQADGRDFAGSALESGASAVLVEAPLTSAQAADIKASDDVIVVPDLRQKLSALAGHFYGDASAAQMLFGITGTNGKTTISQLIAAVLTELAGPVLVAGTLGYGLYGHLHSGRHTTPDAIAMQRLLAEGYAQNARHVSMEVSSHGLDQGRVEALHFQTAIFTNLTRDHLDYHETMAAYGAAKRRLFVWPDLQHAILNADDSFGRELLNDPQVIAKKWAFSVRHPMELAGVSGSVYAQKIHYSHAGIMAEVVTPWGNRLLQSPLLGEFNLSNLLAALTALCANGFALDAVANALSQIKPIAGRMERFGNKHQPMLVVDYAHTPDALEKAIMAMRLHTSGRVAVLFGCGGDRDKGKRPEMGRIAERLANRVVLCNDNPRSEEPAQIAAEILAGMQVPAQVSFIADREQALRLVLKDWQPGDAILLAGKGHEAYTEVMGVRTPYSEVGMVQKVLVEMDAEQFGARL